MLCTQLGRVIMMCKSCIRISFGRWDGSICGWCMLLLQVKWGRCLSASGKYDILNVLHQIVPTTKLIVMKSFICAYPYSKYRYKGFNSHPKYNLYYSSLECNNSIKIAFGLDGGSVTLGTIVMLLFLLSRLCTSTTTVGQQCIEYLSQLWVGFYFHTTLFVVMFVFLGFRMAQQLFLSSS